METQSEDQRQKRRGPPPIPPPTVEVPAVEVEAAVSETSFEIDLGPEALAGRAEGQTVETEAQISHAEEQVGAYAMETGETVPPETTESLARVKSGPRRLLRTLLRKLGLGKEQASASESTPEPRWAGSEIGKVPAEVAAEPIFVIDELLAGEQSDAVRRFFESRPGEIEAALASEDFAEVREMPPVERSVDQSMAVTQVLALNATARAKMIDQLIAEKKVAALEDVMRALMAQYEHELQLRMAAAQTDDERRWARKARSGGSVPKGAPAEIDLLLRDIRRAGEAAHLLRSEKPQAPVEQPAQALTTEAAPTGVTLETQEAEAINEALAGLEVPAAPAPVGRFPKTISLEEQVAVIMEAEPMSLDERGALAKTPVVPAVEISPTSELTALRDKTTARVENRLAELAQPKTEAERAERALLLDQRRELNVGIIPLDVVRSRIATLRTQKNHIESILAQADAGEKQLPADQQVALLRRTIQYNNELIALTIYLNDSYAKTIETEAVPETPTTEAATTVGKAARLGKERKIVKALSDTIEPDSHGTELSPKLHMLDTQIAEINARLRNEAATLSHAEQYKLLVHLYTLKAERYETLNLLSKTVKARIEKVVSSEAPLPKTARVLDTETTVTGVVQAAKAVHESSPTLPEAEPWRETSEKEFQNAKEQHIARTVAYLYLLRKKNLSMNERGWLSVLQNAVATARPDNFFVRFRAFIMDDERSAISQEIGARVAALGRKAILAAEVAKEFQRKDFERERARHIQDTALKIVLRAEERERGFLSPEDRATLKRLAARPPFLYRFSGFLGPKEQKAIRDAIFSRVAALHNSRPQGLESAAGAAAMKSA